MRSSGSRATVGGGVNASAKRADPFGAFNFWVEIEGLVVGGFTEVSGLQVEVETMALREGGLNGYVHQLAGPARYPQNLTLKRGLTTNDSFWPWCQDVFNGTIKRRNSTIYLFDQNGASVMAWNIVEAYPVRWSGPDLRAQGSEVAFETVELAHRGIAKVAAKPVQRRV